MKPIVAILAGHHGRGTGATSFGRDEWELAWWDKFELFAALMHDNIVYPVMEPVAEDMDPREHAPITRAARWALSQKPAVIIDLHYNAMETPGYEGHLVVSNTMTPFVEAMERALDTLPNRHRDTIINADFLLPKLVDPIPCVLLEPAFIFEPCVGNPQWRPMLIAAIKAGIYGYFTGAE